MSRVDENGVRHPTAEDAYDTNAKVHLLYCRECNPYALCPPLSERPHAYTVSAAGIRQMVLEAGF